MTGNELESPQYISLKDRQQQLDMILHLQEFSNMLILIAGEVGVGKTAFLDHVSSQLSIHHQTIVIDGSRFNNEVEVITLLADRLACLPSLDNIEQKLEEIKASSETLHILVDDAHLLTNDALEILLAKALSNNGWHLLLTGNETLEHSLNEFQTQLGRDDTYHKIELQPLTLDQTTEFISALFRDASSIPFSAQKIQNIWQLSLGVPSKILDIISHEQRTSMHLAAKLPLGHVAAVCLIAIALTFSYLYQQDTAEIVDQDVIADLLAGKQVRMDSSLEPEAVLEELTTASKSITPDELKVVSVEIKPEEKLPTKNIEKPLKAKASVVEKVEIVSNLKKTGSSNIKDDHKLLHAAADSYALQLLGVRSRESAQQFVDRFSRELNVNKLDIYETKYRGQPWFVVVYGPFSNKDIANKEAGGLAKTLKNQPWIRPISKIQEDIRQLQVH